MHDIEMTATVGDYENGNGAKLWMDKSGIRIDDGNTANSVSVRLDWSVFDAMEADVERYRRAVAAAGAA